MSDVKEKLKKFNHDIIADINAERKVMLKKAETELGEYYSKKENEYLKEAYEKIQAAVREINRTNQVKRSKIIMEHRMELFRKRNAIVEKIYFRATQKLIEFAKTDRYKDFLLEKLAKMKKVIGEDVQITISYSDRELKEFIETKGNVNVVVADKKRGLIGGLIGLNSDKGILLDESFAKLLSDNKEEMLNFCNLHVD